MARKKLDFTLDEVKEEIVNFTNYINEELLEVFGLNFYLSFLKQPLLNYSDNIQDDIDDHYLTVDDFEESPLFHDVSCAFDYAKGYRYGDINDPDNFLEGMELFRSLTEHLGVSVRDSKYSFLDDLTHARWMLDYGDSLNLKQLAILAGVDERTVRNAASSKDKQGLKTKKSGSSTIVENEEAKRWLSTRPDFKPTEYIEDNTLKTPRYFEDEVGFGAYITYRREELGLDLDALAKAIDGELSVISDLEKGIDHLHLDQVGKLASILKEDRSRFIKDYMRIFHLQELADLRGYSYQSDESVENPERMMNVRLMIFKQQLKLEAQMEITQNQNKGETQ